MVYFVPRIMQGRVNDWSNIVFVCSISKKRVLWTLAGVDKTSMLDWNIEFSIKHFWKKQWKEKIVHWTPKLR